MNEIGSSASGQPGNGSVTAVAACPGHAFSKDLLLAIELLAGLGVAGDGHCGTTVQHRSRVARDPSAQNLRQVHLIQAELFDWLSQAGFQVTAGRLGENITTRGIDLLALPTGTVLRIGPDAAVRLTGLRNPCAQIDAFQPGLMAAVLDRTPDGQLIRKAGVMAVVLTGGTVMPGQTITVELPGTPHRALTPV